MSRIVRRRARAPIEFQLRFTVSSSTHFISSLSTESGCGMRRRWPEFIIKYRYDSITSELRDKARDRPLRPGPICSWSMGGRKAPRLRGWVKRCTSNVEVPTTWAMHTAISKIIRACKITTSIMMLWIVFHLWISLLTRSEKSLIIFIENAKRCKIGSLWWF